MCSQSTCVVNAASRAGHVMSHQKFHRPLSSAQGVEAASTIPAQSRRSMSSSAGANWRFTSPASVTDDCTRISQRSDLERNRFVTFVMEHAPTPRCLRQSWYSGVAIEDFWPGGKTDVCRDADGRLEASSRLARSGFRSARWSDGCCGSGDDCAVDMMAAVFG
jgi:hypothetical protein